MHVDIKFEPTNNRWYMNIVIDGKLQRAYLNTRFEENYETAKLEALSIIDAMSNYESIESVEEITCGDCNEYLDDFRVLVA